MISDSTLSSMSAQDRSGLRENARRLLASGSAQKKAEAQEVIERLDRLEAHERDENHKRVQSLSGDDLVFEAFRAICLTPTEIKAVQALLDNPGATVEQLSRAAGWRSMSWNAQFGKIVSRRPEYLRPTLFAPKRDRFHLGSALANYSDETHGITMKPAAVAAFAAHGLTRKTRL